MSKNKYTKDLKLTRDGRYHACGRVFDTYDEAVDRIIMKNNLDPNGWISFVDDNGDYIDGNREFIRLVVGDELRYREKNKGLLND